MYKEIHGYKKIVILFFKLKKFSENILILLGCFQMQIHLPFKANVNTHVKKCRYPYLCAEGISNNVCYF